MTQAPSNGAPQKAPFASAQTSSPTTRMQLLLCALAMVVGLGVTLAFPSFPGEPSLTIGAVTS